MIEKVGKVQLDLSRYPGEDFYSDGAVEEELLQIVQTVREEDYPKLIEDRKQWPLLYHLSALRENIVDWLPITKQDKVLEVGSGCGAITGALSRKAGEVACVELSKRRSLINAYRHSECENVRIHVGNFKDIEPELPCDYTYICLIGVFEYGQGYIGGDHPYEDFLTTLLRHLAPGGRMVIAIENQYGLKYFAGCAEDHLGSYFGGIEGYQGNAGVRTFGKNGLERMFVACSVPEWHFYYPYPDYKFMTTLYSEERLPLKGELYNNLRNFDRDRMLLFDEKKVFDNIVEEGLFPVFSNSFFVVLGTGLPVQYVKFSNDRAPEFSIRTQIVRDDDGEGCDPRKPGKYSVYKIPATGKALAHTEGIYSAYEKLQKRYQGGKLQINRAFPVDGGVRLEFVSGTPLSELMDGCLDRGDVDGFYKYFREFMERISYNGHMSVSDYDLVFSNILVSGEEWTLLDYEWTFDQAIDIAELAYRAVYCYLLENGRRGNLDEERLLKELGITSRQAAEFRQREMKFQQFVTGGRSSMAQIRDAIGFRVVMPQKWMEKDRDLAAGNRVQIYEDKGTGYREEDSYFVPDAYQGERLVQVELEVSGEVRSLRIDPAMESCLVKLKGLSWNGENIASRAKGLIVVNGRLVDGADGLPTFVFATADPNVNLRLERLKRKERNTLTAQFEVVVIPEAIAQDMVKARSVRRVIGL